MTTDDGVERIRKLLRLAANAGAAEAEAATALEKANSLLIRHLELDPTDPRSTVRLNQAKEILLTQPGQWAAWQEQWRQAHPEAAPTGCPASAWQSGVQAKRQPSREPRSPGTRLSRLFPRTRGAAIWVGATALVLLVALSLLSSGFAPRSGTPVVTTTPTHVPSPSPTAQARPTATPARQAAPTPTDVVQQHYELIGQQDLEAAWALLTPEAQREMGGYNAWADGHKTTRGVSVESLAVRSQSGTRATVEVTFTAVDDDGSGGTVKRTYRGTWQLVSNGRSWALDTADLNQIS